RLARAKLVDGGDRDGHSAELTPGDGPHARARPGRGIRAPRRTQARRGGARCRPCSSAAAARERARGRAARGRAGPAAGRHAAAAEAEPDGHAAAPDRDPEGTAEIETPPPGLPLAPREPAAEPPAELLHQLPRLGDVAGGHLLEREGEEPSGPRHPAVARAGLV